MEDVKNYLKKNICIFCPNNNKEKCMNIQKINQNGVITYKCLNFQKKEKEPRVLNKFIKFEYLNEFNKFVVTVIKETPKNVLDELKIKYDEIEILKQLLNLLEDRKAAIATWQ